MWAPAPSPGLLAAPPDTRLLRAPSPAGTDILTSVNVDQLREGFRDRFGAEPRIFRAPGRVNLIGEHTDYSDGFVMPAAIEFSTYVAAAPRNDRRLVLHSENYGATVEINLGAADRRQHWSDYPAGVAV